MNIYEAAKRRDPDGNQAQIAEILVKKNTVWQDADVKEANDTNSHVSTIRTAHGAANVRRINQGAELTSSRTKQIRDEIMLVEDWVVLDEQIVDREKEKALFRSNELDGCMNGMIDGFHNNLWYGGGGDIGEVTGLSNRFNYLDMNNVRGAGGTGSDLSSIWAIEWSETYNHLIYPKSADGVGIDMQDMGKIPWRDGNNKPFMAYVNQLKLQFGIVSKDDRAIQRLCNIESDYTATSYNLNDADVIKALIAMIGQLPSSGQGAVLYVNRAIYAQVNIMVYNKSNAAFGYVEATGKRVPAFMEVPIKLQESLLPTEDAVA